MTATANQSSLIMATQKADPGLRRNALFSLMGGGALSGVALQFGLPRLMEAIATQEPTQAVRSLQLVAIAALIPALPIAYFAYTVAARVKTSQRFPPPGMAVIRDTEILTGDKANHLGSTLMAASILMGSLALFGIAYLPYLIAQLGLE
ncbi:MAG: hypothetical protein AAGA40_00390 [Cyanobacteria bacterium P01_E01_bin.45]